MNLFTQTNIYNHLVSEYPREGCGLLLADGTYLPCENMAKSGEHFKISAEDWARAEDLGEIAGVVHSHPDWAPSPSEGDRVSCEATQVPWYIFSIHKDADGKPGITGSFLLNPTGYQAPLVGRVFQHGVLDCLQIILDYYQRERGVDLGTYSREDNWWNEGKDYYRELLPKAGFERLDELPENVDLQDGDVVLMQIRSPVPNHAGIYLKTGTLTSQSELYPTPGSILHHLYGNDSKRDVYGGYWLKNTVSIWRYHG